MNQRHIKRGMIASIMLYSSTSALVAVPALVTVKPAQAQVVGIEGCLTSPGNSFVDQGNTGRGGDGSFGTLPDRQIRCLTADMADGPSTSRTHGLRLGHFVTADEVNRELAAVEQRLGGGSSDVNNRLNGIDGKNAEQDNRLNGNDGKNAEQDNRLNGIDGKNAEQDGRLNANDQKNGQQDGRLASIEDGAVFYNRNDVGQKTGGVTFNDGTGDAVRLGNVAAGVQATDAVNHSQLNQAVLIFGGGAAIKEDGSIKAPSYTVSGIEHNNVGSAFAALDRNTVQYVLDGKGNVTNEIRLSGTSTGSVVINNVAAGTSSTSAVNKGQLDRVSSDSFAHTEYRFNNLSATTNTRFENVERNVYQNRQEARGGIASAMGMAALRYDERPGKLSIAGGMGHFKGETAVVGGLGFTAESQNFRANSALSYAPSTDDFGFNVGMSWTLN